MASSISTSNDGMWMWKNAPCQNLTAESLLEPSMIYMPVNQALLSLFLRSHRSHSSIHPILCTTRLDHAPLMLRFPSRHSVKNALKANNLTSSMYPTTFSSPRPFPRDSHSWAINLHSAASQPRTSPTCARDPVALETLIGQASPQWNIYGKLTKVRVGSLHALRSS